jgi:hypothetical protein
VVGGLQRRSDRSDEDGRAPRPYRGAGELVGAARPGVRESDGHVDRDHLDRSVGACGGDQLLDVGRGVGGCHLVVERDADPAGLAGIDSQNPFSRHRDIITPARRSRAK